MQDLETASSDLLGNKITLAAALKIGGRERKQVGYTGYTIIRWEVMVDWAKVVTVEMVSCGQIWHII